MYAFLPAFVLLALAIGLGDAASRSEGSAQAPIAWAGPAGAATLR